MFDYAAARFLQLEDLTVNPINKTSDLWFCINAMQGKGEDTSEYISMLPESCIDIPEGNLTDFNSKQYLSSVGHDVPWYTQHTMHLNFTVR